VWEPGTTDPPRRLLPDHEPPHFDATFAPDGSRLLLSVIRFIGTQGNVDILGVNPDGSGRKMAIAEEQGKLVHQEWPAWSPDGKRLAFSSTHEGNQEIYTAATDGSDVVRLTQHPGHDAHPCWSPDGKSIAFATDRWGTGLEIARVRPDGTGITRLTRSDGLDDYPAYSPDGKRLAFVSNRDGQLEIYVSAADGSHPVNRSRHPFADTFPTWTPDGRGVTFVSERDGGSDIYTQEVEPGSR
jgi:TolB protein